MSDAFKEVMRRIKDQTTQKVLPDMDLIDWGKKYVPHKVEKACSDLHRTQAREYDDKKRGRRVCIVAPRGNAKTTWSEIDCLRALCEGYEPYTILIMDTIPQAKALLEGLKGELTDNERLKHDYPHATGKGSIWNADKIETTNGCCLEAIGVGSKVRGRRYKHHRPTRIIIDDADNDEDIKSATLREEKKNWMEKALFNCGTGTTNIFVVGTMIHRESIVGICAKRPDFKTIIFPAIVAWPDRMDLWTHFETLITADPENLGGSALQTAKVFYYANQTEMDAGAHVLWPEEETLLDLMVLRCVNGHAAFASEKQNDPRDPNKCEFPDTMFEGDDVWYDIKELTRRRQSEECLSLAYTDPAKGKDMKRGDYTAHITGHYFPGDPFIYLQCFIRKIPLQNLVPQLVEIIRNTRPAVVAVEAVGFQELIGDELREKLNKEFLHDTIVLAHDHNNANKVMRIQRLGPWLSRRFFKFLTKCTDTALLVQQLKDFPNGQFDDGPDGLEGLVKLLTNIENPEE